jgi:hypothetical protein
VIEQGSWTAPTAVIDVAKAKGLVQPRVRHELFNEESAWEITGTDVNGTLWMLDVKPNGDIIMEEPLGTVAPSRGRPGG